MPNVDPEKNICKKRPKIYRFFSWDKNTDAKLNKNNVGTFVCVLPLPKSKNLKNFFLTKLCPFLQAVGQFLNSIF